MNEEQFKKLLKEIRRNRTTLEFLLVFAIVLLAACAYVNSQFRDNSWASVLTQEVSSAGIVAGVLTGLLALVGLYAASLRKRRLLAIYIVFLIIIMSLSFPLRRG